MRRLLLFFPIAALSAAYAVAQEEGPQWSTTRDEGIAVASWALPDGSPLLSVACDPQTREVVFFRAVEPPVDAVEMRLVTATGRMTLAAEADPHGAPGIIARAPADAALTEALASEATVTFEISPASGPANATTGGLAVPVGEQFRQIVNDCVDPQ